MLFSNVEDFLGVLVFLKFLRFFPPEVFCKVNLKNFNIFKELLEVPQIKKVLDHC